MEPHFGITLKAVVENPDFFVLSPTLFGTRRHLDEARRLDYGAHLLRVEIFRLKLVELGARADWIRRNAPRYTEPVYPTQIHRKALHSTLLRQVEYLRAELLFTAVRLAKARQRAAETARTPPSA